MVVVVEDEVGGAGVMMMVVVHKVSEGLPLNTRTRWILFRISLEIIFSFFGNKNTRASV
jgi:hypothetical protein